MNIPSRALTLALGFTLLGGCASTGTAWGPAAAPRETSPVRSVPEPVEAPRSAAPPGVLAVAPERPTLSLQELEGERFSLHARDAALEEVLAVLSEACDRSFRTAPGIGARLSVSWQEITVGEALQRLMDRLGLEARPDGRRIVLDREAPATMLIRLPAAERARERWLSAIRSSLDPDGAVTSAGGDARLVLVSGRRETLVRLRSLIDAGLEGDNGLGGGGPWTKPGQNTPSPAESRGRGSPST
jgi:hypothetical protein